MSLNKYRIPELQNSLCGCSLETAAKIIGWLYLAFGAVTVAAACLLGLGITAIADSKKFNEETDEHNEHIKTLFLAGFGMITWFMAFFGILQILINLLLLKGVYQKKSSYVWPWVVSQLVFEAFNLCFDFLFDYELETDETERASNLAFDIIAEIIGLVISLYFIWLVYSYYRQLKKQNDDLPAYESHVYAV